MRIVAEKGMTMKRITLTGVTAIAVVVVIAGTGRVFESFANTVDPSETGVSYEQNNDSTQELILPEKELQQVFEALFIKRIDPPVPMLDFALNDLQGEKVNTETLRGKLLWVNFWNTGCPPCVEEIPSMQKVWGEFGGDAFVLLAVGVGESKDSVLSFLEKNGLHVTFPVLLDTAGNIFHTYGARYFPTNLFIDPQGNIIGVAIGGREWDNEKFRTFLEKISSNL